MKKYIIFDLDWTLIDSHNNIKEIIYDYFRLNDNDVFEKVRYNLDFNKVSSLKDLLISVYWSSCENIDEKLEKLYRYLDEKNHESEFISWTIEKIIKLKNNYKLYLSTWSSTKFANEILKKWWIQELFEIIQWSDKIAKSEYHLELFKEHSNDEYFYENAYSIWDSEKDKYFAELKWIDFIKIWEKYKSIEEIKEI